MSLSRRLLVPGLLAGLLVRLAVLPLPGTGDVDVWKLWSFAASADVTSMYGVGGTPPERRLLHWQGSALTVDYPPLALVELGLAGQLYRLSHPLYDDSRLLTAVVKLPGLAAEMLLVGVLLAWGPRAFGPDATTRAALILWLNPALVLDGSVLGYLDAQMAVPTVLALVAVFTDHPALAGVLLAAAVLTKAQAVFVVPPILAAIVWRTWPRVRPAATAAISAAVTAVLVVLPFVVRGAWSNLTQAVGRLATHDMLSAQSANVWWLFTYVLRVMDVAGEWGRWRAVTQDVRILAISRAVALGYPNARVVGLGLVALAVAWAIWRLRSVRTLAGAAMWTGWCAWAYALLAAQVHENHLILAVPFVSLAAGLDRRYAPAAWAVSTIAALNLYLFEGFGGVLFVSARRWTIVDASVLLAIVNVLLFAWVTARLGARDPCAPGLDATLTPRRP